MKLLAIHLGLTDVLSRAGRRGRWAAADLEKAVKAISRKLGEWFRAAWDAAWVLHVWGFHEAELDSEAVTIRLPQIERMVEETRRIATGKQPR